MRVRTLRCTNLPQAMTASRSQRELMRAGELYLASDPALVDARRRARALLARFNSAEPEDCSARNAVLRELLGAFGKESVINPAPWAGSANAAAGPGCTSGLAPPSTPAHPKLAFAEGVLHPMSPNTVRSTLADVTLRPGSPEDALCLSVLAMQVFLDTYATEGIRPEVAREVLSSYSQDRFSGALQDPQSHITVAERHRHLVGFAQVTFGATHEQAPAGVQAELLRLYVQEPFTGAKLGTQLLACAEQVAAARGATVLWLTPWVHNRRALAFYARRGYADHGLTYFSFEGERHENRVFAKRLAPLHAA